MSALRKITLGLLLLGLAAGCIAPLGEARTEQQVSEQEDMRMIQADLRSIKGRMESLQLESDAIREEWEQSRRSTSRTVDDQLSSVERRLQDLERRMDALDAARERDKQEIVDKLSGTISQLMKKAAPAPAPRSNQRAASGYGYEHAVEPGQTLSAIAQVYGVSVKAIMDANDLQDPNHLRVGQVLFVPE